MIILKATDTDGTTQFFNLDKILSMTPSQDGQRVKILMGAGLYWWVAAESMEVINQPLKELVRIVRGGAL